MFKAILKNRLLVVSLAMVSLHLFLFLNSTVNVFPELFVYPWLVTKGLVPYKDFFDHHGPLLYYVLSFLTFKKSLIFVVLFYQLLQLANLFLFLKILKKFTGLFWYFVGGFLFVFLNYFFSDGNFWFEHVYLFLSLCLLYFSYCTSGFRGRSAVMAALIVVSILIKPTFGLMLVPFSLRHKTMKIAVYSAIFLLVVGFFMAATRILGPFVDYVFVFNRHAAEYIKQYYTLGFEAGYFWMLVIVAAGVSVFLVFRKKSDRIFLLMALISFAFFLQGYTKINMLPFVPYFVLMVSSAGESETRWKRYGLLMIILVFGIFSFRKAKNQFVNTGTRLPYIESKTVKGCVQEVSAMNLDMKGGLYVDAPEYYYLLDQKPVNYYLINLDFIVKFRPDFEKRTIADIENHRIRFVLLQNQYKNKNNFNSLRSFLASKYTTMKVTPCFTYYRRK